MEIYIIYNASAAESIKAYEPNGSWYASLFTLWFMRVKQRKQTQTCTPLIFFGTMKQIQWETNDNAARAARPKGTIGNTKEIQRNKVNAARAARLQIYVEN